MNSPRPRKPKAKASTVAGRKLLYDQHVKDYNAASGKRMRKLRAKRAKP